MVNLTKPKPATVDSPKDGADMIESVLHRALYVSYDHYQTSLKIPDITELLIKSRKKNVRRDAAMAFYHILEYSNSSTILNKTKEGFVKAFAEGDNFTKNILKNSLMLILMKGSNQKELDRLNSQIKQDLEITRRRGGEIVQELFKVEDNRTRKVVDSVLLRLAKSKNSQIRSIFYETLNPYIVNNGSIDNLRKRAAISEALGKEKFARLAERAKSISTMSVIRT
jgi:hypothetical protein